MYTYIMHASSRPHLVTYHHTLRLSLGELALVHGRLHLHLEVRLYLRDEGLLSLHSIFAVLIVLVRGIIHILMSKF